MNLFFYLVIPATIPFPHTDRQNCSNKNQHHDESIVFVEFADVTFCLLFHNAKLPSAYSHMQIFCVTLVFQGQLQ